MKTKIILIRHGYSVSNNNKTFTGHIDSPLTELGYKQADLSAQYLKDTKIDVIYSSDLSRAYETGLAVAKGRNLDVIKDENLREINAGEWHLKTFDEIAKLYPKEYGLWICDVGKAKCPGGESVEEFFKRVETAFLKIVNDNIGKTIAIATHATPIRVVKCISEGKTVKNLKDVKSCPNASINFFEYENNVLKSIGEPVTEHLGDAITSLPKNV